MHVNDTVFAEKRALASCHNFLDLQHLNVKGNVSCPSRLQTMMMGFKAFEKKFKKFGSPATAVNEGKAVDFEGKDGYRHVRNISVVGRVCRLLSLDGYEGSYVIQDALSRGLQLELAHHCLSDCLQPKNKTNLHGHTDDSLLLTVKKNFNAFVLQS